VLFHTHINPHNFGGFGKGLEEHFRGLFKYRVIAIQHGLTVQDLSSTVNQAFDGTDYYCLAAEVEHKNLSQGKYGYTPEQLVPTGLARYDGLASNAERVLLLAPTWRNYLAAPYSAGRASEFSQRFHQSVYVQLYSQLLTDGHLLSACREHGYRIDFLLHPMLTSQKHGFPQNDVVRVLDSVATVSYEEELSRAALMVTDYSGVQFDFAYQYKPIVYFHPPQLPPSYPEGSYEYATMALGDIATTVDSLVELLIEYLKVGCQLKDEYRARIDKFFYFHDHRNAERVYQLGLEVQRGLR
jgi:CDP-glycerol glycerophosphotransferase (TagB/SpsB family)